MGRKAFRFDNGSRLDPGLSLSFSRGIATKDYAGTAVAVDAPRYGRRSLLCGAPSVTTITGTTSAAWNVLATGVSHDNSTPACVLVNATAGKLQIHLNSISLDGSGNATYQYDCSVNAAKNSYPDGLRDSDDAQAVEALNPKGGVLCHGMAAILCTVGYNDGGSWRRNRVGIISCNLANLSGASSTWWDRTWISPETPENGTTDQTNMPTPWAMQNWAAVQRDGTPPTECFICAADYQSTSKLGGVLYMAAASRSTTTGGDWAVDGFQQVISFSRPTSVAHCHGGLVVPDGSGGAKIVVARGDGHANNALYVASVPAISGYLNGASDEAAGSHNSYAGGTGVSTPVIINGRIGGLTGSPPATDDTVETARRYGMQPIGMAQGASSSIILGADEQHTAILMASSVPTSGGITLTPVFRQHRMYPVAGRTGATSTTLNTSRLTFQIINRATNFPTAELVANVTPQASAYQQDSMCHGVYSPNGVEWGVMWNTKVPEQAKPGFFGSTVLIGSPISGDNFGVRHTPIPSYMRGRPLMVDAGATNYLATSITPVKSSGMDGTDQLNTTVAIPSGYASVPGYGTPIYFCGRAFSASGAAKFTLPIASAASALPAVTAGTDQLMVVQFAITPAKVADWRNAANGGVGANAGDDLAPPDSATDTGSNSCSQGFRFRLRFGGTTFTGYTENIYITENDGSPRIISIPVLVSNYGSFSANYVVDLYVESTSSSLPIKGWLTPIGVWLGDVAGPPCAAGAGGTVVPNTAVELSGMSLPTTGWTAYWSGKVPTTPVTDILHACSHNHTSATRTSTTVTRITGANTGLDSVTDAFAGHRLFGNVNSQTASFGDFGIAISASAYVSTGVHDLTHADHGQASGSWTLIDIFAPSSTASASPLFALCNTDSTRRVAVYADRLDGKLKARYWNGSSWGSFAEITGCLFTPEAPIHVSVSYDGAGTITLRGSVNGTELASATVAATPDAAMTKLVAGDGSSTAPAEWWGGVVVDTAESAAQQAARLRGLSYAPSPARNRTRRNRARALVTR